MSGRRREDGECESVRSFDALCSPERSCRLKPKQGTIFLREGLVLLDYVLYQLWQDFSHFHCLHTGWALLVYLSVLSARHFNF